MNIGDQIKTIMKEVGITQQELADKLGEKHQTAISGALGRDMRIGTAEKYLEALGYELKIMKKEINR